MRADVAAGLAEFETRAGEAAGMLKLLANERRLKILCRLGAEREMSVGTLAQAVDLSQSALSQHLAKMRDEGLVATRRDAQTVFYRIADHNVARVLSVLKRIYCP
jgi:DNA-binding transcriptional ArsR family regulator